MTCRRLTVWFALILISSCGDLRAGTGDGDYIDLDSVRISGKTLAQAIDTLTAHRVPFRIEVKRISEDASISVLTGREGGGHRPSDRLRRGDTLTVYVKAPLSALQMTSGGPQPPNGELDEKLTEIAKLNEENDRLKSQIRDAESASSANLQLPRHAVAALYLTLVLFVVMLASLVFYPKRVLRWIGPYVVRVGSSTAEPAQSWVLDRFQDQACRIDELQTRILKGQGELQDSAEARIMKNVESRIEEVTTEMSESLELLRRKIHEMDDQFAQLPVVDAFNQALNSHNRDKQSRFKTLYKVKMAGAEGEAADKGYMAPKDAQYLLRAQEWGNFIVADVSGTLYVFPDFEADILSRQVSSAFNMRLTESPGPERWYIVYPAEAARIAEHLWQLTKTGEIGGRGGLGRREATPQGDYTEGQLRGEIVTVVRQEIEKALALSLVQLSKDENASISSGVATSLKNDCDFVESVAMLLEDKVQRRESGGADERRHGDRRLTINRERRGKAVQKSGADESMRRATEPAKELAPEEVTVSSDSVATSGGMNGDSSAPEVSEAEEGAPFGLEVMSYNRCLTQDKLKRDEFVSRKGAVLVSGEVKGKAVNYKFSKEGSVLIIRSPNRPPDEYLVFPVFSADIDDSELRASFRTVGATQGGWQLKKPGECRRISEYVWQLTRKGEIEAIP